MSASIEKIMDGALKNIKDLVDVDTIIGTPINAGDKTTIIPISRVAYGFGVGGSEFQGVNDKIKEPNFGGGVGGGMSISPVGFLVVTGDNVRMINVDTATTPLDKLIDVAPGIIEKVVDKFTKKEEVVSQIQQH